MRNDFPTVNRQDLCIYAYTHANMTPRRGGLAFVSGLAGICETATMLITFQDVW